jgi:hypothetical protein
VTVRYEIRQQVSTVRKSWLEVISSQTFERPARDEFDRLQAEHPGTYFELVEVLVTENCLAHTGKAT